MEINRTEDVWTLVAGRSQAARIFFGLFAGTITFSAVMIVAAVIAGHHSPAYLGLLVYLAGLVGLGYYNLRAQCELRVRGSLLAVTSATRTDFFSASTVRDIGGRGHRLAVSLATPSGDRVIHTRELNSAALSLLQHTVAGAADDSTSHPFALLGPRAQA